MYRLQNEEDAGNGCTVGSGGELLSVSSVTRHDALAKGCNVFYSNWVPVGEHWPEMLYFDRTFVNRRFYVCECLHVELFIPPTLQVYL